MLARPLVRSLLVEWDMDVVDVVYPTGGAMNEVAIVRTATRPVVLRGTVGVIAVESTSSTR